MSTQALNMTHTAWQEWCLSQKIPVFRAQQLMEWMYVHNCFAPQEFLNLPQSLRDQLEHEFSWSLPSIDSILTSVDGSEKFLLKFSDGRFAECVLMPSSNRVTLCVSSQVGCRMACSFCQTGKMGFERNLSVGEILVQAVIARKRLAEHHGSSQKLTHIVFMGMGEPLDNMEHVVAACRAFLNPKLFGLSRHRVTVSTSGLVPEIIQLGQAVPVALAISLHTADNAQRSALMPLNKKYPLLQLKEALLQYSQQTGHSITFEYVMIQGENDSLGHAQKLIQFLHGLKAKVNLIPLNAHPGSPHQGPSDEGRLRAFQKYLSDRSVPAPVRYSRGQDVSAACGQLAAKRQEDLQLPPRTVALARRREYLKESRAST